MPSSPFIQEGRSERSNSINLENMVGDFSQLNDTAFFNEREPRSKKPKKQ